MGDEFTDLLQELKDAEAEEQTTEQEVLTTCRALLREIATTRQEYETLRQALEKQGVDLTKLLAREQSLRDAVKSTMLAATVNRVYDPQTHLLARVIHSFSDVYDAEKLTPLLTPTQRVKCLTVSVDGPTVKKLVETGALDYNELLQTGALERRPRAKSLRVDVVAEDA